MSSRMVFAAKGMSSVQRATVCRRLVLSSSNGRATPPPMPRPTSLMTPAVAAGSILNIRHTSSHASGCATAGNSNTPAKMQLKSFLSSPGNAGGVCSGTHRRLLHTRCISRQHERGGWSSAATMGASAGKRVMLLRPWQHMLQVAALQSSSSRGSEAHGAKGPAAEKLAQGASSVGQDEDKKKKETAAKTAAAATGDAGKPKEEAASASFDAQARRVAEVRNRLRDARLDASEDAKDWIRDKRDDMDDMRETLRDARRDGRLREELSDQAKEGRGRLQVMWKKYGAVGIGCYFTIYFGSVSFFYVIYDYGLMTNLPAGGSAVIEHMQAWMKSTPEWAQHYSDRLFSAMAEDHRARSFVLAWATCKVLEPLRLIASIAVTPKVARALGRAPAKGFDNDDDEDQGEGREGDTREDKR